MSCVRRPTRSTSAGNSPRSCAAAPIQRCWTATRRNGPHRQDGAAFHRPGPSPSPPPPTDRAAGPDPFAPTVIPLALKAGTTRAYGFRTVSQLGIRYRHSPLSVDGPDRPRKGPKAGDRLPDASIVHGGQPTRLHRVLAGAGWHLLLLDHQLATCWTRAAAAPVPAPIGVVILAGRARNRKGPGRRRRSPAGHRRREHRTPALPAAAGRRR